MPMNKTDVTNDILVGASLGTKASFFVAARARNDCPSSKRRATHDSGRERITSDCEDAKNLVIMLEVGDKPKSTPKKNYIHNDGE